MTCSLNIILVLSKFIRRPMRAEDSYILLIQHILSSASLKCEKNLTSMFMPHSFQCSVLNIQCISEQFGGNYVPLSHSSMQVDKFRLLILYLDGYSRSIIKASQQFEMSPIDLAPLQGLKNRPDFNGVEGFLIVHKR